MFIDTHAHFDICSEQTGVKQEDLIKGMEENSVKTAVQVATEVSNLKWSYDFSLKNNNILCALGIHPTSEIEEEDFSILSQIVDKVIKDNRKKLFGIGEIGLDYHWMTFSKEKQRESFIRQIEIAQAHDLPVIVHSRDAFQDTYDILKEMSVNKGILHCFVNGKDEARAYLDLGLHISFAGNVTFKKSVEIQEAAAFVPMDRLFLETDCPYLTPVPNRGKKNKPEYVVHTYNFVSQLRNISPVELAGYISLNFENFMQ